MVDLQHVVPAGAQKLLQLAFGIKAQAGIWQTTSDSRWARRVAKASVASGQVVLVHLCLACG